MGGLSFLSPLFLIGALTVAIPVVLHLFRRRNDPVVPFSAMRFLHQVPIEQARRRRLQDLLLLALRVAALLLLAIGFARPYLQSPTSASEAGVTVVAVDVSASMGDAARFARARTLAQQAIDSAPAGDQVAVMQFAGRADVMVEPGADRTAARAAVTRLQPTFGPTRYHAAIARGLDLVGTRAGRLVLVTDLQSSGWTSADAVGVPARVSIEVADVGPLPPNVGIAALDRTPQGLRVGLTSTGASRGVEVELSLDGRSLGRQRVTLPADGTSELLFRGVTATAGAVRARLVTPDGIPADDERWLVLDPRPGVRAAIIASPGAGLGEAVYVRRALEAAEGSAAWRVEVGRRSACARRGPVWRRRGGAGGHSRPRSTRGRGPGPLRGKRGRVARGGGTGRQRGAVDRGSWLGVSAIAGGATGRDAVTASSPRMGGTRSSACSIQTPAHSTRHGSRALRRSRRPRRRR